MSRNPPIAVITPTTTAAMRPTSPDPARHDQTATAPASGSAGDRRRLLRRWGPPDGTSGPARPRRGLHGRHSAATGRATTPFRYRREVEPARATGVLRQGRA